MIGQTIRDLRKQKRMSQTELAKIIHVSQQTVTAWETGKAEPSSSAVSNLADYFNVTTDYLLGRPEKKKEKQNVELTDDDIIMTYQGKELSDEDREIIKRLMNGKQVICLDELIRWLLNYAFDKGINYIITDQLNEDVPSCAIPNKSTIIINSKYGKPTELPFTIAHEIGHVLNGEADILYFSGFNNHSKIEMRANRRAVKLLLEYCNCHDLALEPAKFAETFGIPSSFEDMVKEESVRYYLER